MAKPAGKTPPSCSVLKGGSYGCPSTPSSAEGPWRERVPKAVCPQQWLSSHPPAPTPGRLLHYFRGRHHLEEIMYNENTRRSQLLALVDKFRSVLVVTTHEDPVIAVFQALLT